ncbi:MAG: DUF692 domain-containing protein [Proteobacteria bacterium]|nr:DUF692 domain-containing protein [Pseudomonadota bacterium]
MMKARTPSSLNDARGAPLASAGVGLKPVHYREILESRPALGFFEVHAENYMGAGGPPHRYLTAIRERYPLSLHGVGLSLGADRPLDRDHLRRLKELIRRYEPMLFSEHLAWSSQGASFLNDLLPLPYTDESLRIVIDHVDHVQDVLGRQMALENPSTYVRFADTTYSEVEFIAEVARCTGCALLLDVNNVHVSCTNHGWDPQQYLRDFPVSRVREIHLAGHASRTDGAGRPLLIDSHDCPVAEPVWQLFALAIELTGPRPTLIEWDNHIPAWTQLESEAQRAQAILAGAPAHQHEELRRANAR